MDLHLLILTPDQKTRKVQLDSDCYTVGRAHANDISYPEDASLSRRQFKLFRDTEDWWVEDLGSKNGTMLNGVRIAGKEAVRSGDRIAAGHLMITVADPQLNTAEQVQFVQGVGPEITPDATVMTSLEGLLSGDSNTPVTATSEQEARDRNFASPVVAALVRAGRELAGHRPLEELFPLILDLSIGAVNAERGVVMTLENGRLVSKATHGEGFQISTTVRDRVVKERTSILVRDLAQDKAFREQASIFEQQIHTMMAAPLQTEKRVIGLIYVDSKSMIRQFTTDDLNLLTVLANVAAIRIEHERFSELERIEQRRTRDLEQAAEIQRGILPETPPTVEGLDLAGHNAPCHTVGGDYYDFLTYPDGRLAVVLGDVAGKGMSAAMLMSNLQARVQTLADQPDDLAALMSRLDSGIAANCPSNRFITMFLGLIDRGQNRLTSCNAGHNPTLLVRKSGEIVLLGPLGTVLGIMPELGYEQQHDAFDVGDLFCTYSDGVTEAESPEEVEFGEDRLGEIVAANRHESSQTIIDRVLADLDEWTNSAPAADDITLVVVRRVS